MKTPKPGQFCTIEKVVYRAYRAKNGCQGCAFNNMFSCLGIIDGKTKRAKMNCKYENIIFKRL